MVQADRFSRSAHMDDSVLVPPAKLAKGAAAMTRLGPSHIPGAEDGLFARVAVPPGTLLSFYHGLNVPYGCDYSQELYAFDEVDAEF